MRLSSVLALCATLLTSAAMAQARTPPAWPLDTGTLIRVQATGLGFAFRRGTLKSTTADSISLKPSRAGAFSIGLDQISSLQVLRESHTAKAKYTMIGLLVGAAGGAILGAMTYSPSKCDSSVSFCVDLFDQGSSAAMGAVLLGGVGALVGFIAGAAPKETWVPVTIPTR